MNKDGPPGRELGSFASRSARVAQNGPLKGQEPLVSLIHADLSGLYMVRLPPACLGRACHV